jgi:hypothetical protein
MIMKNAWICLAFGTLLSVPAVGFADDLATNGGFEIAGTNGAADSAAWTETVSGAPGSLSERVGAGANSGGFAHKLVAFGSAGIGANSAISQSTIGAGLPSLVGGSTVSASYRGNYNLGPGGVGFRVLRVLNGAGQIVAQSGLQVITGGTNGQYQTYTLGPVNVPAMARSIWRPPSTDPVKGTWSTRRARSISAVWSWVSTRLRNRPSGRPAASAAIWKRSPTSNVWLACFRITALPAMSAGMIEFTAVRNG